MPDAITIIKRDHASVKADFNSYLAEDSEEERAALALQILDALDAHAQMEETIFYPVLAREGSAAARRLVEEAIAEHAEMKAMIARLRDEMDLPAFALKLEALMGGVKHHIQEEEAEILPEAKDCLSKQKIEELGEQMEPLSPSQGATFAEQVKKRVRAAAPAIRPKKKKP